MRRCLTFLLLTACCLLVWADGPTSGSCGVDMKWKFSQKKGELTIRGAGMMNNYSPTAHAPWHHLSEQILTIEIQRSVVSVGDYAFAGCTALQGVEIDLNRSELSVIGESAFADCRSLTALVLPDRVYQIGSAAFARTGLQQFTMPAHVGDISPSLFEDCRQLAQVRFSSIQTIGASAFSGCQHLFDITLPNTVNAIGSRAFRGCSALTNLQLPESLRMMGEGALSNNIGLTEIRIPAAVDRLEAGTLEGCTNLQRVIFGQGSRLEVLPDLFCNNARSLDSICLPGGLKHIGSEAMSNCFALKHIALPLTLQTVGARAFTGSGLTDVSIPGQVSHIGDRCFYKCQSLRRIDIDRQAPLDTIAYELCTLSTELETVNHSDRTRVIAEAAFSECYALKNVSWPEQLEQIGPQAFQQTSIRSVNLSPAIRQIGVQAFSRCKRLRTFSIASDSPLRELPDELCAHAENLRRVSLPRQLQAIGRRAFYQATKLQSVNLTDQLQSIGDQAFQQTSIRHLYVGRSLQQIGTDAFAQCTQIDSLTWNSASLTPTRRDMPTAELRHQIRVLYLGQSVGRIGREMCAMFDSTQTIRIGNPSVMIAVGAFGGNRTLRQLVYPSSAPAINTDIAHLYVGQRIYHVSPTDTTTTLSLWPVGALSYFDLYGPVRGIYPTEKVEQRFLRDNAEVEFDRQGHISSYNRTGILADRIELDSMSVLLAYDTTNTLVGLHGTRAYTETIKYDDKHRVTDMSAADNFTDITRIELRYDERGQLVGQTGRLRYEQDGRIGFRNESRVYQIISTDEYGNWTARKDDQGNITTRRIDYYQP